MVQEVFWSTSHLNKMLSRFSTKLEGIDSVGKHSRFIQMLTIDEREMKLTLGTTYNEI